MLVTRCRVVGGRRTAVGQGDRRWSPSLGGAPRPAPPARDPCALRGEKDWCQWPSDMGGKHSRRRRRRQQQQQQRRRTKVRPRGGGIGGEGSARTGHGARDWFCTWREDGSRLACPTPSGRVSHRGESRPCARRANAVAVTRPCRWCQAVRRRRPPVGLLAAPWHDEGARLAPAEVAGGGRLRWRGHGGLAAHDSPVRPTAARRLASAVAMTLMQEHGGGRAPGANRSRHPSHWTGNDDDPPVAPPPAPWTRACARHPPGPASRHRRPPRRSAGVLLPWAALLPA